MANEYEPGTSPEIRRRFAGGWPGALPDFVNTKYGRYSRAHVFIEAIALDEKLEPKLLDSAQQALHALWFAEDDMDPADDRQNSLSDVVLAAVELGAALTQEIRAEDIAASVRSKDAQNRANRRWAKLEKLRRYARAQHDAGKWRSAQQAADALLPAVIEERNRLGLRTPTDGNADTWLLKLLQAHRRNRT